MPVAAVLIKLLSCNLTALTEITSPTQYYPGHEPHKRVLKKSSQVIITSRYYKLLARRRQILLITSRALFNRTTKGLLFSVCFNVRNCLCTLSTVFLFSFKHRNSQ